MKAKEIETIKQIIPATEEAYIVYKGDTDEKMFFLERIRFWALITKLTNYMGSYENTQYDYLIPMTSDYLGITCSGSSFDTLPDNSNHVGVHWGKLEDFKEEEWVTHK